MLPSVRVATLCHLPPSADAQVVAKPICTGASRSMIVPSPSCSSALSPQAQSVPSVRMASVCDQPALTDRQVVAVPICTGASR